MRLAVGEFGHKLRVLRTMRNWSQSDLARQAKVTPEVVSRLELGTTEFLKLTVEKGLAIARAFGMTIEEFIAWRVPELPPPPGRTG